MINKVILVGNVGKEPELKHFDGGRSVARFPLATNEQYKNKAGEQVSNTEWHNVVLWSPLAGIAEKYIRKGFEVVYRGARLRLGVMKIRMGIRNISQRLWVG